MREMNEETLKLFLEHMAKSEDMITHTGYLLIPDDERLNAEALSGLKSAFREFCE